MKLKDMPTDELRQALRANEEALGRDAYATRALRRELEAREKRLAERAAQGEGVRDAR